MAVVSGQCIFVYSVKGKLKDMRKFKKLKNLLYF